MPDIMLVSKMILTIFFTASSAWTVKFNANPCAFHQETQWTTIEVDRPSSENPLVVLSPGIAFLHTHKFLKSVAGFYGPNSVMMSPFNGVYALGLSRSTNARSN